MLSVHIMADFITFLTIFTQDKVHTAHYAPVEEFFLSDCLYIQRYFLNIQFGIICMFSCIFENISNQKARIINWFCHI